MLNLDVWGSFEPIGPQCYDIQMTRAAAHAKLSAMRSRVRTMIDYWDTQVEDSESGLMIKKLIAQIELIDFYLAKIESYLNRK
jgi:hypothetical protein